MRWLQLLGRSSLAVIWKNCCLEVRLILIVIVKHCFIVWTLQKVSDYIEGRNHSEHFLIVKIVIQIWRIPCFDKNRTGCILPSSYFCDIIAFITKADASSSNNAGLSGSSCLRMGDFPVINIIVIFNNAAYCDSAQLNSTSCLSKSVLPETIPQKL
jgi:hypothetical protein